MSTAKHQVYLLYEGIAYDKSMFTVVRGWVAHNAYGFLGVAEDEAGIAEVIAEWAEDKDGTVRISRAPVVVLET